MSLSRRLRNIAKTQLNNIKERLDRIDEEADAGVLERRAERDAENELNDPTDIRILRRSPEEIATGSTRPKQATQPVNPSPAASPSTQNPLAIHYRVLGLEPGADLTSVEAAYSKLSARNLIDKFPEGSEERESAQEIFKRVDGAYNALRDALDATAGRFDKLEL
jgi:hypothetical protein